ncbi:MAG: hypothetical protein LAT55_02990 [Opitutales bacterium]|nr:hypothetical protein [Opitutales bacterium]
MKYSISIASLLFVASSFLYGEKAAEETAFPALRPAIKEALSEGETIRFDDDRILISFAYRGFPSGASGRMAVESLQMEVYEVLSWRSNKGRHVREISASLRAQGVATTSINVRASDHEQQLQILEVLAKAMRMIERADQIRDDILAQYGNAPFSLDNIEIELGEVYFYPSRKKIPAVLDLDFSNEIYALMIGNGVRLNPQTLPVVYYSLARFPQYAKEFSAIPEDYGSFLSNLAERLEKEKDPEDDEENDGQDAEEEEEAESEEAES